MFIRFDRMYERDRQTPHDDKGRAYASHRAAKIAIVDEYLAHHCCTEVTCCQHSDSMRPIVSTDDARYTTAALPSISEDVVYHTCC